MALLIEALVLDVVLICLFGEDGHTRVLLPGLPILAKQANQNYIENFFSCCRSEGQNNMPNAEHIASARAKVATKREMGFAQGGNYEQPAGAVSQLTSQQQKGAGSSAWRVVGLGSQEAILFERQHEEQGRWFGPQSHQAHQARVQVRFRTDCSGQATFKIPAQK